MKLGTERILESGTHHLGERRFESVDPQSDIPKLKLACERFAQNGSDVLIVPEVDETADDSTIVYRGNAGVAQLTIFYGEARANVLTVDHDSPPRRFLIPNE